MRLTPSTIDQIRNATRIVEVVNDFVTLKKRGSNWMACCPFHAERTPSFAVSQSKDLFKCFGCGKGGDAITFVMEIENYSFTQALEYLAGKYGIPLEYDQKPTDEQQAEQNERESLLILHEFAKNYFQDMLHNHADGQAIGLSYFKERGFNLKTIQAFDLGYSLPDWEAFTQKAIQAGFSEDLLVKSGIIGKREDGKLYDRFRERVIFPIHNLAGKPIAFGARILKAPSNSPKGGGQAKYINSPETTLYHKSHILYGISQAKKAIKEQDNCYLVEGYTDVISLHQADVPNVVASSGTSLTVEQIRLIRRFTDNVTVLYDGDSAGIKASLRGIDMLLEEGLNVQAVSFPDGDDPDSYVKKVGSTAFKAYLAEHSRDFITFKAELYLDEIQQNPIRRAEVIRDVVSSIVKIPDEIKRAVFYQECSRLFKIDEQALVSEGNHILQKNTSKSKLIDSHQPQNDNKDLAEQANKDIIPLESPTRSLEREAIRILLAYGATELMNGKKLAEYVLEELADLSFEHSVFQSILDKFRKESKKNNIPTEKDFLKSTEAGISQVVADLVMKTYTLSENWEKRHAIFTPEESTLLEKVVNENILRLKMAQLQKLITENQQHLEKATTQADQDKYLRLALQLETYRKQIAQALNNVIAP